MGKKNSFWDFLMFNEVTKAANDSSEDDSLYTEEELDSYGLDEEEKEQVRNGLQDPWDFEEDPDTEEDSDYYSEDDFYRDDIDDDF